MTPKPPGIPRVRPAHPEDIPQIRSLLYLGNQAYFFTGWDPLEYWPAREPFLVLTRGTLVSAAMAAPLDTEETAWLRLFAFLQGLTPQQAWEHLWPALRALLAAQGVQWVMGLGMYPWLETLYQAAGFQEDAEVITLHWQGPLPPWSDRPSPPVHLRLLRTQDVPAIAHVDARSFPPRWRIGEKALQRVLPYLLLGLVAEQEGRIVGYLLAMETPRGGHITRLGVLPEKRGQGIGGALVHQALRYLVARGVRWITVNTQRDNDIALRLYARMGFRESRHVHRVWYASVQPFPQTQGQEERVWASQPLP